MEQLSDRATGDGRAAVVCNGRHPDRAIQTSIKPVTVRMPNIRSMDGKPDTYHSALEEVALQTRYQRCWVHKKGNVLNCFLKLTQPRIKQSLHDIWQTKTREDADRAFDLFILTYEDKYPKATSMLQNE